MEKLKSFIYLNTEKVYSISSQIFEGLTEYIVSSNSEKNEEIDQQKGTFASGRLMADIIEKQSNRTEKKFLHDYSYIMFEKELLKKGKVLSVSKNSTTNTINDINKYTFIKITGRVCFNDTKMIEETISNFNEIGFALGYITNSQDIEKIKELKKKGSESKDRNTRSKIQNILDSRADLRELFKEKGLQLDPNMLASLEYILRYGYNQQFEILMPFHTDDMPLLFSSILDRNMLKEEEHIIIKKYSRETEKEFTIFGIITQCLPHSERLKIFNESGSSEFSNDKAEVSNMKQAIWNFITLLTNVEKTFTGKLNYECVIDPIAVYMEI